MVVETASTADVVAAATVAAPDLLLLMGSAVVDGGRQILAALAANSATSVIPVALLQADATLDERLRAFRSGAVAIIPRSASVDDIASRVTELVHELPNRPGEAKGALGESTLDELVALVSQQLRTGILSVERADAKENSPIRLVLGPGERVASALDDFVKHLKGLIAEAEPLEYELFEASGGRLRLDDGEGAGDLAIFAGLRIMVMDDDPGRADGLAAALRDHGASVAVTNVSVDGLERAHRLDPEIVLLDSSVIEGAGFEAVRTMRRDSRLRWASLLVLSWDEVWPKGAPAPDMEALASKIEPVVEPDRELAARAARDDVFDTRLELTGPGRLLRALVSVPGTRHVVVRSAHTILTVDLADGLIVSASGKSKSGAIEGQDALATLLLLATGRVHVETRLHPSAANVMMPVEEALSAAGPRGLSVPPSNPPPPLVSSEASPSGAPARPSPPADGSGPLFPPHERSSSLSGPSSLGAATKAELSWGATESSEGAAHPFASPTGAPPADASSLPEPAPQATRPKVTAPPPVARAVPRKPLRKPPPPAASLLAKRESGPSSATASSASAPRASAPNLQAVGDRETPPVPVPVPRPASVVSRRSGAPTMVGAQSPPPPDPDGQGFDDDEPTLIGDSRALAAELAAAEGVDAAELGQKMAQEVHEAPTMPPPPSHEALEQAMRLDGADGIDLEIGDPVAGVDVAGVAPPARRLPSDGAPAGVVVDRLSNYEPTLSQQLDPEAQKLLRGDGRGGGGGLVGAAAVLAIVGLAWVATWRFAPSVLPTWAGGSAVAVAPDPDRASDPAVGDGALEAGEVPAAAALAAADPADAGAAGEVVSPPGEEPAPDGEADPDEALVPETVEAGETAEPGETETAEPSAEDPDVLSAAEEEEDGDPDAMSDEERDDRSDHLARLAERMLRDGQLLAARRYANRALRIHDHNPQALAAKARVHLQAREGAEAVRWAELAARRRSRRAPYQVLLGDAQRLAGNAAAARRAYERALEIDPEERTALRRLGR